MDKSAQGFTKEPVEELRVTEFFGTSSEDKEAPGNEEEKAA
jgi:hypothetical protein